MHIPLQLICPSCGAAVTHRVHLNNPSADFTCEKCAETWHGVSNLDNTIGVLILARSKYELVVEKDYDMAIVLAATAFDCELSSLFCKWKRIEAPGASGVFGPEECEKELRGLGNVAEKITKVSGGLYGGGIEKFIADSGLMKEALQKFPSLHAGSLATDFQETVFWPRNKVLHQGEANHSGADASRCYSIAELGIRILKDMDKGHLRDRKL